MLTILLFPFPYSILEKDPAKRPSASEVLKLPYIAKQMEVCYYLCACTKLIRVMYNFLH